MRHVGSFQERYGVKHVHEVVLYFLPYHLMNMLCTESCCSMCGKCKNVKDAGAYRYKHLISQWECYHPKTSVELTETKIKEAEARIKADIDDTKKHLEELKGKSKIKKHPDPTDAEDKNDSIDFQPTSSDEENDFFDLLWPSQPRPGRPSCAGVRSRAA